MSQKNRFFCSLSTTITHLFAKPGNLPRYPFGLILALCFVALHSHAAKVENFVLLDHLGDAHELYYHRQADAVVIMAQDNHCASSQAQAAQLASLQAQFSSARFYMLNSNHSDDRTQTAQWAAQHAVTPLRILDDDAQLIAESLQLQSSGDVVVIQPPAWQTLYRGDLAGAQSALQRLVNAEPAAPASATLSAVPGCKLDQSSRPAQEASISYSQDIAPLLQDKCVVCHTEGGLGPWAMSSYNMVRGFAPMIREVVRTRRMPPWHADRHVGQWQNNISLTPQQTRMLVHWIEAGAPRGAGTDPLANAQPNLPEWPLGEPDLILHIPPHTVPATGVVDYQFPTVANPLSNGVWIRAATVVPGDREVVHHILAGTQDDDTTELRRNSGVFDNYLIGYAPGNESHQFPTGTGVYIPPGGEFLFQMHYTPVGRETIDRSRIGLYFHKEVPANFFRQGVVVDPTITIPPGNSRHAETAYYQFADDALLHNLVPHAHYRGVASRFELWYPDGRKELILNVPNYDFNWQRTYEFVVPKPVAAGTRLVHTTWYDNSADNPANPDPQREVPWGLQSWDEMLYGAFSYTLVDESTETPIHDRMMARTSQYVGFLDKNIDGKLSWRELPREIKKRLVQGFKAVDKNGDGGLDHEEMHIITMRLQQASEQTSDQTSEPATEQARQTDPAVDAR